MSFKSVVLIIFSLCSLACSNSSSEQNQTVTTTISGSRETPDPVLVKVNELVKKGEIKDLEVMESFPVQIKLSASKSILDQLNKIPRK